MNNHSIKVIKKYHILIVWLFSCECPATALTPSFILKINFKKIREGDKLNQAQGKASRKNIRNCAQNYT